MKNRYTRFWLGMMAPGALLALVVANLCTGKAYMLSRGELWVTYTDAVVVAGLVVFKMGIIGALFAWYFLAETDRTEHLAFRVLAPSIVALLAGLVIFLVRAVMVAVRT